LHKDFKAQEDSEDQCSAGTFKQSMGARNRVGIWLSYRPARLLRLAEFIPGPHNYLKKGLRIPRKLFPGELSLKFCIFKHL
jgi:hypothetical protein